MKIHLAAILVTLAGLSTATAAPIRVDFSGPITFASGILTGVSGTVEGYVIYDDEPPLSTAYPGYYLLSVTPYRFHVAFPGLGEIDTSDVSILVSDDGRYTDTYPDEIDFWELRTDTSTDLIPDIHVSLFWSGSLSAFAGDDVPSIAETMAMYGPSIAVWPAGDIHYVLSATAMPSVTFTPVPLPGSLALALSAFGLLGIRRGGFGITSRVRKQ